MKSLFIFDNAESYEDIKEFLPLSLPPSNQMPYILITSRNKDWKVAGEGRIEVIQLKDSAEIKVGKERNLYAIQSTSKTIDEIIESYPAIANKLNMTIAVQVGNESILVGHGKCEVLYNNPIHNSHLIGNSGENIYIITIASGEQRYDHSIFSIPQINIYNLDKGSSIDTLDLRNVVKIIQDDLRVYIGLPKISQDGNDLLVKLEAEMEQNFSLEVLTVRLKNGLNWYEKLHIISNNAPMKISSELELKPLTLIFDRDKEIIVVTDQDVEKGTELIISKKGGNYTFIRSNGNDLMITNAFDSTISKDDLCSVTLSKFYEAPKMKTLFIKFADKEIVLKDHEKEISAARNINTVKKEYKDQVYNDVFSRYKPQNVATRNRRHKEYSDLDKRFLENIRNSGTKASSWINDLFGWVKSSIGKLLSSKSEGTASSVSQVDGQFAKASISNSSFTGTTLPSDSTGKRQENGGFFRDNVDYVNANLKRMCERQAPVKFKPSGGNTILEMGDHYLSQVDFNGTITLFDLLIRRVTGQKYISTVDKSISLLEVQGYALNITKGFEKVVEQAALKSGISMHRLNIDYMGMQKEITRKVMSGKFNEISGILNSYVERACPGREAVYPGKLSPKKFDKFMIEFNRRLNVVLDQPMQQMLHNGDDRLEVDGAKQMSLEPQSYLSNASVQGHLARDKVKSIS